MKSRRSPHSEALRDGAAAVGQGLCLLLSTVRLGQIEEVVLGSLESESGAPGIDTCKVESSSGGDGLQAGPGTHPGGCNAYDWPSNIMYKNDPPGRGQRRW